MEEKKEEPEPDQDDDQDQNEEEDSDDSNTDKRFEEYVEPAVNDLLGKLSKNLVVHLFLDMNLYFS